MATIERGNWSFRDPGGDIPDGSIINGGNFSQLVPDTVILAGKTLTINGGNWCNVEKDANWTVKGDKEFLQVSRCSHLHPKWVAKGLPECVDNCPHVIETIEIVGGDDAYVRKDTVQ